MALTLDPALEQRIQLAVATGFFREPSELLAHALDLVEAEQRSGDWLFQNRDDIRRKIEESVAARKRGESYSPEEAHAILAERRAARVRQAA